MAGLYLFGSPKESAYDIIVEIFPQAGTGKEGYLFTGIVLSK